jgi:hypothetical protein
MPVLSSPNVSSNISSRRPVGLPSACANAARGGALRKRCPNLVHQIPRGGVEAFEDGAEHLQHPVVRTLATPHETFVEPSLLSGDQVFQLSPSILVENETHHGGKGPRPVLCPNVVPGFGNMFHTLRAPRTQTSFQ